MYIVLMINQETRSLRCKKGSHPSSWSTRYRQYRIHLVVIHLSGSTLPWTCKPSPDPSHRGPFLGDRRGPPLLL
ncbi:hypothetical protein HZ326_25735 [Fusarium oxysporum f. sp. albedinis]|nr:hypothetical protein HZ326_25735 [Fusarium oxysporum f. sp. albedinis]